MNHDNLSVFASPVALQRRFATLRVTGTRRSRTRRCFSINFADRQVSGTKGREMVCLTLYEVTVACNVHGDAWQKFKERAEILHA